MIEVISQAIDTGNVWIVLAVVLGAIVYFLYNKSNTYTDERMTELKNEISELKEENKEQSNKMLELTQQFVETVNSWKEDILDYIDMKDGE